MQGIKIIIRKGFAVSVLPIFVFLLSCGQSEDKSNINKAELAEKVKKEFLHAWNGYKEYAWGHDALKPLSKSYRDWYGKSFYMTPLDAFDTMLLMGLTEEAAEAKKLILDNLSFDKDISVQNFEITIRLLGGLLSAYQLDGDKKFLELAEDLGNRLLPVFDSPTGMPYVNVNLKTGERSGAVNNPAEIGTLMLEFGTLGKLTGNNIYYDKAKRGISELYKRRSGIDLVGTSINVETGEWVNTDSHISGMIDSYYEYLLKSWLLFKDEDFKEMWDTSIAAVNKYIADTLNGELWYGVADMNSGIKKYSYYGALDAFFPAVLSLGGDLNRAELLQESNFKMWKSFDIEPEQFDFRTNIIIYPGYYLRPENIESAYYLYKYTGDERYLEMAKFYFDSIVKYCRCETGYAHLKSVVTKEKDDAMESFFLAETLKYLYLIFADPEVLDFEDVIFNTEAHPLKRTW